MSGYLLSAFIQRQRSEWEKLWNDHEWLKQHGDDPILGGLYKRRYQELYDAEEKRYWNDFYRNTGAPGSQYWTHRGEYRTSSPNSWDYAFEATEAVMSLYAMMRFKW